MNIKTSKNKQCSFRCSRNKWQFRSDGPTDFTEAGLAITIDEENYDCLQNIVDEKEDGPEEDIHGTYRAYQRESFISDKDIQCKTTFRVYSENSFLLIDILLTNKGKTTRTLGQCKFLGPCGTKVDTGQQTSNIKILCQSGWCIENKIIETDPGSGNCLSKTIGLLFLPQTHSALNCSFLTFDRANTEIAFSWEKNGLTVGAYCDFDGYELSAGKSVCSETFHLEWQDDPLSSLENWADKVNKQYQPNFQAKPSIGWVGGWQWRDWIQQETYEEIVLGNLKAIENKFSGFGLKNIWISIGNLKDLMPSNWLEENTELFPLGWKHTIKRIYEHNLRPGFWVAPFWIPDKLCDSIKEHKDNLLKKDGEYVRFDARWGWSKESLSLPVEERPGFYSLDGSHPHTKQFLKNVFSAYNELGIKYYMIDFLYSGSGSTPGEFIYDEYHDKTKIKGPEVYREALKSIREAAGKDTYLLASTGPTFQNIGCVDAVRAGPDFGEGRPLIERFSEYPATYKITNLNMLKHAVINFATTYFTNRKLYHNDIFNVLTVDKPVPLNEAQIAASMLALSGAPVMLGDDIASINDDRLSIIKKCLPPHAGTARPVDLFTSSQPVYHCTFNLSVKKDWDSWNIIGILNLDDKTKTKAIDFKALGLAENNKYTVYDFWNEQYLGAYEKSFSSEIPPYSIKLYRIGKSRKHPWVLSTDMHITQGGVEMDQLQWDEKHKQLRGLCKRPKNEKGNLIIHLPIGWRPLDYRGVHLAKNPHFGDCILTKPIHFTQKTVIWSISFAYDRPDKSDTHIFKGDEREVFAKEKE